MVSKTRMLSLVQTFKWKEVKAGLAESPQLLNFRDKKGRNWLHLCCAVNFPKQNGQAKDSIRTAAVLLDAGLEVNAPSATEGTWRATALWHSIAFGENLELSRYLLKRGADPDHCLWAAVNRDSAAAIRLLVKNGANDPTTKEASPLLAAIQWGKFTAAGELLRLGADVNFQDQKGMTALHHLLKKSGDKKYLRMLAKYGARGDLKDASGRTATEIMQRKKDPEVRALATQLVKSS